MVLVVPLRGEFFEDPGGEFRDGDRIFRFDEVTYIGQNVETVS